MVAGRQAVVVEEERERERERVVFGKPSRASIGQPSGLFTPFQSKVSKQAGK